MVVSATLLWFLCCLSCILIYLAAHPGGFPGRRLRSSAIDCGQTDTLSASENAVWLPYHHGRRAQMIMPLMFRVVLSTLVLYHYPSYVASYTASAMSHTNTPMDEI